MRARMKYQDPEKLVRRRRQSDRTESGDMSSSSSTHESYQMSSGISVGGGDYYIRTISSADDYQTNANKTRSSSMDSNASSDVFETANRRLSSPFTSHSGVVTASLKIPVQVQSAAQATNAVSQNIQFYVQERPPGTSQSHHIGDHITDIPFIEETGGSFDFPDDCE